MQPFRVTFDNSEHGRELRGILVETTRRDNSDFFKSYETTNAMYLLKREVDRALHARWQSGPESFWGEDHRTMERAIHPRQLSAKFNRLLCASVPDPRNRQKLTTTARAGVEGEG